MSTIVFVTWDGGGNVPPAVGVAQALHRRGHIVRFLGHRRQADMFAKHHLDFTALPTAYDFDVVNPHAPLGIIKVFTDRALGRDVVTELRARPADIVVVDCYLFGAMAALRDAGIAYVTFEHSLDGYLRRAARGPLGLLIRLRGLSPQRLLDGGSRVVVPTLAAFDPDAAPTVTHTGPVVSGTPATPSRPTILISLSTVGFASLRKTWQRILDGVTGLPARIIVTTGPSVAATDLRFPDGAEVHAWLSHNEIMPQCSLVITHGGHATAMTALAHDLPMLIIPIDDKTDQPTIAKTLDAAGAAIALTRRSSSAEIRRAVQTLLADGPQRVAAAQLGAQIRAHDGAESAADLLESCGADAQSRTR